MRKCWQTDPNDRIPFLTVVKMLMEQYGVLFHNDNRFSDSVSQRSNSQLFDTAKEWASQNNKGLPILKINKDILI